MSELSGGVMLTENALRCVARNIEIFYKKKAQNRDWCITTVRNAADQFEKMREEISTLRAQPDITGETSDGYHTFNELYHHRAVLFSVICNSRPDIAWKAKRHHDGTMYNGMFIVGINTPDGQATYHYDMEPYWEMFRVPELLQAPEWDGHTPAQAIERIGKLSAQPANEPLTLEQLKQMDGEPVWVSAEENGHYDYCGAYKYGFCAILRTTITHPCATSVYGIRYSFEDYGKTWLAYAHKLGGE